MEQFGMNSYKMYEQFYFYFESIKITTGYGLKICEFKKTIKFLGYVTRIVS